MLQELATSLQGISEVTDEHGCSSESFHDFLVAEAPTPELNFLTSSVCLPTQVEIHNTTTGAATFELEVPGFFYS